MAFPYKVNRVTISGISFGGDEEWSTGFYHGEDDADAEAPLQATVDAIAAAWMTFFSAASTKINNTWGTTQVKMATMGTDGKTIADSVVYYNPPATVFGGSPAAPYPPQIALVATLQSVLVRGLASKGRMYLPGVVATLNANARIADADRLAICTNLRNFMFAAGTVPGANNRPMLASFGRQAPLIGAGVFQTIQTVRVGNVYDTQRRRRNALTETYSSVAI